MELGLLNLGWEKAPTSFFYVLSGPVIPSSKTKRRLRLLASVMCSALRESDGVCSEALRGEFFSFVVLIARVHVCAANEEESNEKYGASGRDAGLAVGPASKNSHKENVLVKMVLNLNSHCKQLAISLTV